MTVSTGKRTCVTDAANYRKVSASAVSSLALPKDVRIETLSVLPSLLAEIKAEITETLRTIEEGKRSRPSYNPK